MYSPQVLDHFANPRNTGDLPDAAARVQVDNPVCGDLLELAIKCEKGIITAARFRARGCVASMACASALTEEVIGKSVQDARRIGSEQLLVRLGSLPQASEHAGYLAVDALHRALDLLSI